MATVLEHIGDTPASFHDMRQVSQLGKTAFTGSSHGSHARGAVNVQQPQTSFTDITTAAAPMPAPTCRAMAPVESCKVLVDLDAKLAAVERAVGLGNGRCALDTLAELEECCAPLREKPLPQGVRHSLDAAAVALDKLAEADDRLSKRPDVRAVVRAEVDMGRCTAQVERLTRAVPEAQQLVSNLAALQEASSRMPQLDASVLRKASSFGGKLDALEAMLDEAEVHVTAEASRTLAKIQALEVCVAELQQAAESFRG